VLLVKAVLTFAIILFISFQVNRILPVGRQVDHPGDILGFKPFWSFVVYFSFMSVLASFVRLMINMFGKGQLIRILLGKYRHPSEEKRVFLFLDLKSSVAAAEKLGHIRYSELIQECYYDLDKSVIKHRGEIYQYVGDEAVVTWPYSRAIKNNNCVDCFLDFRQELVKRQSFYQQKFGLQPQFKAGLHGGPLTAAEVGGEKKEIAYHGDVINTASRIQNLCNQLGKEFLVSERLSLDLKSHALVPIGSVALKGRVKPVVLYGLKEMSDP
jgi:adenylate cyclase